MTEKTKQLEPVPAPPEQPPGDHKMLVTHLKSLEGQVGEHVISALQIPNAVAAISMVFPAPQGGQNIVSIPLPSETWDAIRELLQQVEADAPDNTPCVGFHCYTDYYDQKTHDTVAGQDENDDADDDEKVEPS